MNPFDQLDELEENVKKLKGRLITAHNEILGLNKQINQRNQEIKQLRKELRELKKCLS
jgi:uncharacterized coiled-coil DUF342 family protein